VETVKKSKLEKILNFGTS